MQPPKLRPGLLILALAIPLCLGMVSSMLSSEMMKDYAALNKPPLSPPGWLFPIVWTVLYLMMGLASYFIITADAAKGLAANALLFYAIQLLLNFFWSILFFRFSLYLGSFIELCAMWTVTVVTIVLFFRISTTAGVLMIPYALWTAFAGYLNFAVYRMSVKGTLFPN